MDCNYWEEEAAGLSIQLGDANEEIEQLRQRAEKAEAELAILNAKGAPNQKAVRRFAIEQQIKGLEDFREEFDAQNDYYGNSPMAYLGDLESHIKQLRKEIGSD